MTRWLRNSFYATLATIFLFTVANNLHNLFEKQTSLATSYGLAPLLPFPSVTICAHKRINGNYTFGRENHLMLLKHSFMTDDG